jgi:hypothetical protein
MYAKFHIFSKLLNMFFYDFTGGGTSRQWEKMRVPSGTLPVCLASASTVMAANALLG